MDFLLESQETETTSCEKQESITLGNSSYQVEEILGSGTFSIVYRATNKLTGQPIAFRTVFKSRLSSSLERVLLENERKVLTVLMSKNRSGIINCFEIFDSKENFSTIMEICEGGDLETLSKKGKLPENTMKKYLLGLINAYIELNEAGIVHRDLKPANILIDQNGNLKIGDFGFAVIQENDENVEKKYNYCLGSPVYCSPESLENFVYGQKSDIWALGVIVYKMIKGKTPWKGKKRAELILNMKEVEIKNLIVDVKDTILRDFIIGSCRVDVSKRLSISNLKEFKILLERSLNVSNEEMPNIAANKVVSF